MFTPNNFFSDFLQIIREPIYYHLWFVYAIIGIYLFTPFLRKMLQNLNDKECFSLFILIYIVAFIKYFLPSCGITVGINNLLIVEWIIPFVLGYLTTRTAISKHYKVIYILGVLSLLFFIFALRFLPDFKHLKDISPTMQIETQAIFLFFIRNKNKICSNMNLNKLFSFISVYSYEIYLLHAKIIDVLQMIFSNTIIVTPYITMLTVAFLTFVFSFAIAFVINNIIKAIFEFFYFIVKRIRNLSTNF